MVVVEGIRRSGKSFTVNTINNNLDQIGTCLTLYKDMGVPYAMRKGLNVDDYVIGRDITYAQFFSKMKPKEFDTILFDRQYLTSYVYGQFYRDNYSKELWKDHIEYVESIYDDAGILDEVVTIFIQLGDNDFEKIAEMEREKDNLESSYVSDYMRQYELYQEALEISNSNKYYLNAFQSEEKLIKDVKEIIASTV